MSADPFAGMVKAMSRREAPVATEARLRVTGRNAGITDELLQQLEKHGAMSTSELKDALGLADSRYVWGALKTPQLVGRVQRSGRMWMMNPNYLPPYVERAIEVLRDLGWSVNPPTRRPGQ